MSFFCPCKVINDKVYDLQDTSGHVHLVSVTDTHLLMPAEYIAILLLHTKAF